MASNLATGKTRYTDRQTIRSTAIHRAPTWPSTELVPEDPTINLPSWTADDVCQPEPARAILAYSRLVVISTCTQLSSSSFVSPPSPIPHTHLGLPKSLLSIENLPVSHICNDRTSLVHCLSLVRGFPIPFPPRVFSASDAQLVCIFPQASLWSSSNDEAVRSLQPCSSEPRRHHSQIKLIRSAWAFSRRRG